jgi:DNA-binding NarL/FixJ family response regulator
MDAPIGRAFLKLAELGAVHAIVVSDNPCPEYKLDLLQRNPAALLGQVKIEDIGKAIKAVRAGHTLYPTLSSCLTHKERETLRYVAEGYALSQCAKPRGGSAGTLRNTIHAIYTKLGLRSHVQLAHYYYGNWTLLEHCHGWQLSGQGRAHS